MTPNPLSPEQQQEIDGLLQGGNKIAAIKLYRQYSGKDLKEAKEAVEARSTELSIADPVQFKQKSGCLGVLLFGLGLGVASLLLGAA